MAKRFVIFMLSVFSISTQASARNCEVDLSFGKPEKVVIHGYDGDAMEPFMARDGRVLFFNNRNDHPKTNTNVFYADRIDDTNFLFRGELQGVNSAALDAVPSATAGGDIYFVSTRSYEQTLSTLYQGRVMGDRVYDAGLVPGISAEKFGNIHFDLEISSDGQFLFYSDGAFSGNPYPDTSTLRIAMRTPTGFIPHPDSDYILKEVNTGDRQYAAAISEDGRELFFTRLDKFLLVPRTEIYHATWNAGSRAFNTPVRIGAIQGDLTEAPTTSPDSCALYYHEMEKDRYIIKRVTRR